MKTNKKALKRIFEYPKYVIPAGLTAGFINGLLGAGGGIILVFTFSALRKSRKEYSVRDSLAMTVATVLPISALSVITYYFKVQSSFSEVGKFLVPAVIGGIIGAYLTDRLNTSSLKTVFAVITMTAGINMIFR